MSSTLLREALIVPPIAPIPSSLLLLESLDVSVLHNLLTRTHPPSAPRSRCGSRDRRMGGRGKVCRAPFSSITALSLSSSSSLMWILRVLSARAGGVLPVLPLPPRTSRPCSRRHCQWPPLLLPFSLRSSSCFLLPRN